MPLLLYLKFLRDSVYIFGNLNLFVCLVRSK